MGPILEKHTMHRRACTPLFRRMLLVATLAASVSAEAAPLSIDNIRADAEQYGAWTARFSACGGFFHEQEGLLLGEYVAAFNERARQDVAEQTGNPRFSFDDAASGPDVKTYGDHLGNVIRESREALRGKIESSPAACRDMVKTFAAYYVPFRDKVLAPLRAEEDAQRRAQAPMLEAVAAFEQALGKQDGEDAPRRPSDVASARKLMVTREPLRAALQESGDLLCEAARYTDPDGLRFLLTEVWPKPEQTCPMKEAAQNALVWRRYDNAAWLADRVNAADLPDLALTLLQQVSRNDEPTGGNANAPDEESLALPVMNRFLELGLQADAESSGTSLLAEVIRRKEVKLAALLLAHGADPNGKTSDADASPLLVETARSGSLPLVKVFLAVPGIQLDAAGRSGMTALEAASGGDDAAIVAALLDAGAKLPTKTSRRWPLLVTSGNAEIAKLLIKHGADPRWQDVDGNTLLAYMNWNVKPAELIPVLVDAGLSLNTTNRYGATILNYASGDGALASLAAQRALLIKLGAKPGKADERLAIVYEPGHPASWSPYRIRLANGRVITGKTDVFGKTGWVPNGQKFSVDTGRTAL